MTTQPTPSEMMTATLRDYIGGAVLNTHRLEAELRAALARAEAAEAALAEAQAIIALHDKEKPSG